ncbi:MAG: amino acid adenylation domain-containing protein, partial [bacterium]|nr:amino acid adenylation domain-containing protein [bacterium]
DQNKFSAIEPAEKKEYYPVSSAQKRMYILQQMEINSIAYNMPEAIPLPGTPDTDKLENTFRQLINRHESLRTSFHMIHQEPVQQVHNSVEFSITPLDLTKGNTTIPRDTYIRPFDLSQAPLLRVGLAQLENNRYILLVDMHHIISDGLSMQILIEDYTALYQAQTLPPLRIQYKDFSQWWNRRKEKENVKEQAAYWLNEFQGEIPVLHLPTDYPRPSVQSFEGDTLHFHLDKKETDALKKLAMEEGLTLYMLLLALCNIFLAKISCTEDIVIGTPTAGRRHPDLEQVMGMFINTLAMRNYPVAEKTFREFLKEIKERTLEAFENQEYQFEDLVEQAKVPHDAGRNPLFDVMFALQNFAPPGTANAAYSGNHSNPSPTSPPTLTDEIKEISTIPTKLDVGENVSKFDLTLNAADNGEQLSFSFQYCTRLFKKESIQRFSQYYRQVLTSIPEPLTSNFRLSDVHILSQAEKEKILSAFNGPASFYPTEKTLNRLWEEQAEKTPDRVALVFRHNQISYRELECAASNLATRLRRNALEPGKIIGILMERSTEMIIALLAVLKAGGAYLPLDPHYPADRINFILKDSNAQQLICNNTEILSGKNAFQGEIIALRDTGVAKKADLRDNEEKPYHPEKMGISTLLENTPRDIAYVIYTSGSTGKPRGVLIEHSSAVNLAFYQKQYFGVTPDDRILQFSSISFDASVEQIFIAFFSGAGLVLVDRNTMLDENRFTLFLLRQSITHLHAVPSFLQTIPFRTFPALKRMISGGDQCPPGLAQKWQKVCKFYNEYGPTETTVTSIQFPAAAPLVSPRLPIGTPLGNTDIYLLDRLLQPVPPMVPGELYIGGAGIARGYLNHPQLTAEKFVPFQKETGAGPSSLIYKTGDLCRRLPDGNLEFLDRIDHQVKIRGYRIELGEIENHLMEHPAIRDAVVIAQEHNGDKHLCAYFVAAVPVQREQLEKHLQNNLPDYMLPTYFTPVPSIPLTPSGKTDRNALPEPFVQSGNSYIAPRDEMEKTITEIWSDVLGIAIETCGIQDQFFRVGGHSLSAVVLLSRLHKTFNVKIPLVELFKTPTISGLAESIRESTNDRFD